MSRMNHFLPASSESLTEFEVLLYSGRPVFSVSKEVICHIAVSLPFSH